MTLITLIPKTKNPRNLSDWRPISLCNTSYNILPKFIVARLNPIWPIIINQYQGAFTQGRSSLDNAMVILEILHSIFSKNKRISRGKSCIAMKLNMAKAYDRIQWGIIEYTLNTFNFPLHIIRLIMSSIKSRTMEI